MNLLPGRVAGGRLTCGGLTYDGFGEAPERVLVGLRPENLVQARDGEPALEVGVELLERLGGSVQLSGATEVEGESASLTAMIDAHAPVAEGDRLRLSCPRERLRLFDPETGLAL